MALPERRAGALAEGLAAEGALVEATLGCDAEARESGGCGSAFRRGKDVFERSGMPREPTAVDQMTNDVAEHPTVGAHVLIPGPGNPFAFLRMSQVMVEQFDAFLLGLEPDQVFAVDEKAFSPRKLAHQDEGAAEQGVVGAAGGEAVPTCAAS